MTSSARALRRKYLGFLKGNRDLAEVIKMVETEFAQLQLASAVAQAAGDARAILAVTKRMRQYRVLVRLLGGRITLAWAEEAEIRAAAQELERLLKPKAAPR